MEIRTTPEVETLFSHYELLQQQLDYRSIAKLYGNKIIAAGPYGIEFHSNNFVTRWQFEKSMRAFYHQAGLTSMRILRLHENKISEQYSLVNISWSATFSKTHSQPFEFHISYLVRKRRHKAEIIMFIAHEDEKKVLQGYGILTS
ncbi:MAG TPA: hypothetical protein VFE50_08880 [Cyclobacteriaceae bacterium]|nr:hypothetical protein [Cyclobacteriaceae bacterium]